MRWLSLCVALFASSALADQVVLNVCTSVPRESPWGQVLRAWAKAVNKKTNEQVDINFFWNSSQGDEPAQMALVKTGQSDGAVVTAVGLGIVDPNVNVLQMPGLYADWAQLDAARAQLTGRFEKKFDEAGLVLVGWGDVGLDRLMTHGYPAASPDDLKGKRVWVWKQDQVLPPVFQLTGSTMVQTTLPEVIPALAGNDVTAMSVSALAAEQLQWSSRLDFVNKWIVAPNIGGLVLTKKGLAKLTAEQQTAVIETGKAAAKALTDRIRTEDAKAFERLSKKMTLVESTPEQLAAWQKVFAEARARIAKGTVDPELLKTAESFAK